MELLKRMDAFIFLFIVGLIIVGSLAIIFYSVSFQAEKDKIGIIELSGEIISGDESPSFMTTGELQRAFENARRDERVKAVVLVVDSPGGEVAASYEMYSIVKRFEKPVVAFIRGTGASGAYLACLGADNIVSHQFSTIGSIGAYIPLQKPVPVVPENAKEILAITSGKLKNIWADGVLDENEREFLKMRVDETKDSFFDLVFQRTRVNRTILEKVEENVKNPIYVLAEGGWLDGKRAFELGLIDSLGDIADALRLASKLAGIELEKSEVVNIAPPPPGTYGNTFYEIPVYKDNEYLPIYLK